MRRSHPTARAEFFKIMLRIKSRVVHSEDNTNEVANGFCRNRFFVEGNNDRHQFLRCERTASINCCRFYSEFFGRNMPRDLICIRHYYKQICELISLPKF